MSSTQMEKNGIAPLFKIAGKRKKILFISGFLAIIQAILSLVPYILVFYTICELTKESVDFMIARTYIAHAIIAAVLSMGMFFLSGILSHIASINIIYELRNHISKKAGKLPMGYFYNRNSGALKKNPFG
nr:ABC transporter ATP-binding protein [Sphingobacterium sp. ML3W]